MVRTFLFRSILSKRNIYFKTEKQACDKQRSADTKDPRNSFKYIRHKSSSAHCSDHAGMIQEVCSCFGLMKITAYYGTLESDISVSSSTRKPEDVSLVGYTEVLKGLDNAGQ